MERRFVRFSGFAVSGQSEGFFVHDFVRADVPFDTAVGAFTHLVAPSLLQELVAEAWREETKELGRMLGEAPVIDEEPGVSVSLGEPRGRRDAVIFHLSWSGRVGPWVAPIDADLELVSFGPTRTHLHLLGRSTLPPGVTACTDRASVEHRLTVAVVRHVLSSLAARIEAGARQPAG